MQPRADRGWALTAEALERLLTALDPDRERAAESYERLRDRVIGLLRWWGADEADALADTTLDRVARKLEEGAAIAPGSVGAYVRGVARMVFLESARHARMQATAGLPPWESTEAQETAAACMDRCLARLEDGDRLLVLRYYAEGRASAVRRKLADELGISATALRIRVHRLRERLEQCVSSCLDRRET
jgi:DNA-directed RNA polymerase specialized sigma24 family protein